jgi:hypothetical protein
MLNIPKPPESTNRAPKFMGELPYSLPINGPKKWLVSYERSEGFGSMMMGRGRLSDAPVGIQCPKNWADNAQMVSGGDSPKAGQ